MAHDLEHGGGAGCSRVLWQLAQALIVFASAVFVDEHAADALLPGELCHDVRLFEMPESFVGAFELALVGQGGTLPPAVAAAAAHVVWRFEPPAAPGVGVANLCMFAHAEASADSHSFMSINGRMYRDIEGRSRAELAAYPQLICSVAASLAAAGPGVCATLTSALLAAAGCGDATSAVTPRTAACCALPGCGAQRSLKLCAGCQAVKYCSKDHQKADWKRHKHDCKNAQPQA